MNPIYNETVFGYNADYTYIEDLNGDDIFEIALMTEQGNVTIISGIDGSIIRMFNMPNEWDRFDINQLGSDESDMEAYILINCVKHDSSDICCHRDF